MKAAHQASRASLKHQIREYQKLARADVESPPRLRSGERVRYRAPAGYQFGAAGTIVAIEADRPGAPFAVRWDDMPDEVLWYWRAELRVVTRY